MRALITLLILIGGIHVSAQPGDSIMNDLLRLERTFPISKGEAWVADLLGNVYMTNRKVIQKYDSTGTLKFTQSIKSFGRVSEIHPVNTMKLVLFSEDQQILCWMDNTLTLGEECFDLSLLGVGMASYIEASSQPDKVWVVDQLNSELMLVDLSRSNQSQAIRNMRGMLKMSEVRQICETQNRMYILDGKGMLFSFDLYGSLLATYAVGGATTFAVKGDLLLTLENGAVILRNLSSPEITTTLIRSDEFLELMTIGDFFYFRKEKEIFKYSLKLSR